MTTKMLFERLWTDYVTITPSAKNIKAFFESSGNEIHNDHVAFRTFDDPRVNIDVLAGLLLDLGYVYKSEYYFTEKKLYAKHFEHSTDEDAPLIFISQLIAKEFSLATQTLIKEIVDSINFNTLDIKKILFSGRLWNLPSYETYSSLLEESEYAAWVYVNGFCANHFTVDVNKLDTFNSLEEVNYFLKINDFQLNMSGGEIKGTKEQFLLQSSTLADKIEVQFQEGTKLITSCYYEFAYRFPKNGRLFKGFIASSADKIFESTDMFVG